MFRNEIELRKDIPLAHTSAMIARGKELNKSAARHVFENALLGKAVNTERRKMADLRLFEDFLASIGVPAVDLYNNPEAWRGITWGTIDAFKIWMISEGYSISTINARLSTIRFHVGLTAKSGVINETEARLIASIKGFQGKEGRHVDEKRVLSGTETRRKVRARIYCNDGSQAGAGKKAAPIEIPDMAVMQLMDQPNTPQGRRDRLLMCLLLEHGLRIGEVAILTRSSFDLKRNLLLFSRPKVDLADQKNNLSLHTQTAAEAYLFSDAPATGIIWRRSFNDSAPLGKQLTSKSAARSLTRRVAWLGRVIGIYGLSAHDCRHYWATNEARNQTPIDKMMAGGGWKTPNMALRYVNREEIANEGTYYGKRKEEK
jgi:integrase